MSSAFVIHSRAGEAAVSADSMADAVRWQKTLRGVITQGGVVVAEALS